MNQYMIVWPYDQPPYYLAAELEEMRNDGSCKPKGFDFYVQPVKILPFDADRIKALKRIGDEFAKDLALLKASCRHDAQRVMFIE